MGDGAVKRPTYIIVKVEPGMKKKVVELLKEFKECFAWDYDKMSGLSRNMVKLKLSIRPSNKPVKQMPRRFTPKIMSKIKQEIERMLGSKFIITVWYVEWLANIVPVFKNNGTFKVCIYFRDLNNATPKDEYPMPVAEKLVDSATGHEYLNMLDMYYGYNQIV